MVSGQSISKVHLVLNDANQSTGEAFVMFANVHDIELALGSLNRKKVHNKFIKVYRSSEEQFQHYCNTATVAKSPMYLQNGRINSVPNLGENLLDAIYISFDKI